MHRGAWWATVHGIAKSQTQLSVCTHTKINKGQLDSAIPEGPWNKGVRVRILVETSLEY